MHFLLSWTFGKLKLDKVVVLKNYKVQDKPTIVITKTTKVFAAGVVNKSFSKYTELAETNGTHRMNRWCTH